jgi:hypothetical protein
VGLKSSCRTVFVVGSIRLSVPFSSVTIHTLSLLAVGQPEELGDSWPTAKIGRCLRWTGCALTFGSSFHISPTRRDSLENE